MSAQKLRRHWQQLPEPQRVQAIHVHSNVDEETYISTGNTWSRIEPFRWSHFTEGTSYCSGMEQSSVRAEPARSRRNTTTLMNRFSKSIFHILKQPRTLRSLHKAISLQVNEDT